MSAEIWAIGGGKGGTGKTFLTSSLAIYLAESGKKVTLIDADLGGANLHSVLKIKQPKHSLTDFFEDKIPISDIIEETGIPNLRLVTGDIRTLSPDSVKYTQRLKLYRQIKAMSGDYVLIDLGAGSSLNTIDTFLQADKMIVITLPEVTAIENLYLFLKKALFRKLNVFLGDHQFRDAAKNAWNDRKNNEIKTIKHLINYFKNISSDISQSLENEFHNFKVNVVINQVRHHPHLQTGLSTKSVIIKYFGVDAIFSGYIKYNDAFWRLISSPHPFLHMPEAAHVYDQIRTITHNIIENKHLSFSDVSGEENA